MKDLKGAFAVFAVILAITVTAGCFGFYMELSQLKADCHLRGYGDYVLNDGKLQFYLFDNQVKPTTKADRRPSEFRPCGEFAGRKVKMAAQ